MKCGCSNDVEAADLKNCGALVGWLYFSFLQRATLCQHRPHPLHPHPSTALLQEGAASCAQHPGCAKQQWGTECSWRPCPTAARLPAHAPEPSKRPVASHRGMGVGRCAQRAACGAGARAQTDATPHQHSAHGRSACARASRPQSAAAQAHGGWGGGGGTHSSSAPFFILPRTAASFFSRSSGVTILERIHLVIQFSWSWCGRMSANGSCVASRGIAGQEPAQGAARAPPPGPWRTAPSGRGSHPPTHARTHASAVCPPDPPPAWWSPWDLRLESRTFTRCF